MNLKFPSLKLINVLVLICACLLENSSNAGEVMVAVASNFSAPMQKIAESFERETGHKVVLAFGASGGFYAQIKNGAPYQVFLSADHETIERLIGDDLAQEQSQFTYAVGRLILWSAKEGYVDAQGDVLKDPKIKKIAIANPKLAPYGVAALQALEKMQLLSSITPKLVIGENVSQTFQFVSTQNADLGFFALSQVYRDGKITRGSGWMVPPNLYEPIRQDAVLLKSAKGSEVAKALMNFLKTDRIKSLIKSYGYSI
jgi:molybdate transport system substrate-binding protein